MAKPVQYCKVKKKKIIWLLFQRRNQGTAYNQKTVIQYLLETEQNYNASDMCNFQLFSSHIKKDQVKLILIVYIHI